MGLAGMCILPQSIATDSESSASFQWRWVEGVQQSPDEAGCLAWCTASSPRFSACAADQPERRAADICGGTSCLAADSAYKRDLYNHNKMSSIKIL